MTDPRGLLGPEIDALHRDPMYLDDLLRLDIAESVYVAMKNAGLTETELARRSGMNYPGVIRLLRGSRMTTLKQLVRVALALNCELRITLEARGDQ